MDLTLVSRHLKRMGDHATNICEDVIFMVKGKTSGIRSRRRRRGREPRLARIAPIDMGSNAIRT